MPAMKVNGMKMLAITVNTFMTSLVRLAIDDKYVFISPVTIGENGITEKDLIVHNAQDWDDTNHYRLVRMGLPDFPVAMGVVRSVESGVYEAEMANQVQHARENSKIKNVDDLLNSGNFWINRIVAIA